MRQITAGKSQFLGMLVWAAAAIGPAVDVSLFWSGSIADLVASDQLTERSVISDTGSEESRIVEQHLFTFVFLGKCRPLVSVSQERMLAADLLSAKPFKLRTAADWVELDRKSLRFAMGSYTAECDVDEVLS